MTKFPYPMWVVVCEDCGPVCTVWEKPGTGCSYIEHCPECGGEWPDTVQVDSGDEHERVMSEGVKAVADA